MNKSKLFIDEVQVPVMEELQINISKLIADVQNPDQRNTDFSNTISIPGCAEIDKLFEFCFEVNIALQSFNPNLKTPVSYRINNTEVIAGWLKITRIRRRLDLNQHVYDCEIKGHFSDLFFNMGDKFLTALSFSEYDHLLTRNNVTDGTFTSNYVSGSAVAIVPGIGYRYALVDYGYNNAHLVEFQLKGMRPILFAYEYLLKTFASAGKTFSSTFLSSAFFKRVAILPTEIIKTDATTLQNTTFSVGQKTSPQIFNFPLTVLFSSFHFRWNNPTIYNSLIRLNSTASSPYYDSGGLYDTTNGVFTVATTGRSTIKCDIFLRSRINTPSPANVITNQETQCTITMDIFAAGVWTGLQNSQTHSVTGTNADIAEMFSFTFTGNFTAGTQLRLRVNSQITNVWIDQFPGGPELATGTVTYDIYTVQYGLSASTDPYLTLSPESDNINEGQLLQVDQCVPTNIKQRDFVKGIINMFNLYVDIDKDNPNNYIIEPEPNFFNTTFRDWSKKLDISQEIVIEPTAAGQMKGMKLLYKSDGDYYNKDYQDQFRQPYGTFITQSENQFNTEIKTIEVPFSPTPLVGNDTNKLLIPKIYKNENGTVSPLRANIRIGLWSPTPIDIYPDIWVIKSNVGDLSNTQYPYVGHLDNPRTPTYDLNFGIPFKVYYKPRTAFVYPAANIWTSYYKTLFDRLTHKDSKKIIAHFNIDEIDFKVFDFRNLIYVMDMYCRVSAINDFNILENKTTKVELLKI